MEQTLLKPVVQGKGDMRWEEGMIAIGMKSLEFSSRPPAWHW